MYWFDKFYRKVISLLLEFSAPKIFSPRLILALLATLLVTSITHAASVSQPPKMVRTTDVDAEDANVTFAGAPINLAPNDAPNMPILVQPAGTAVDVSTSPTLEVTVTDPEAEPMTVRFYGRPLSVVSDDFTLIALPDTQIYAANYHNIFNAQTQWIVANKSTLNIAHVTQLGDCVDNGNSTSQWDAADEAFGYLEDPATTGLSDGISYSIAVGNKDQKPSGNPNDDSTALYNQYFGISRFNGRSYYGGYYGSNFDNHYELFSASGMDFILISLEYRGSTQAVLDWTDNILATYSDRRAIVVTHHMLNSNGSFSGDGQDIYEALQDRPNLFLLLGGHVPGEGRREDTHNGRKVHSLFADYQSRSNGGNGWLRILEFSPNNNEIRVKTYSPTLEEFETDADSEFTLDYDMQQSEDVADFQLIGEVSEVTSGSNASITWPNLANSTAYEWYVTVGDGTNIVTGDSWGFTTVAQKPQANFSADKTAGEAPLTVSFTDLSQNVPTSWSWDFGDGNSSTAKHPNHTYDTPGTYTVSLRVTNDVGSDLLTRTDYIEVSNPPMPTAYFTQTMYDISEAGGSAVLIDVALSHPFPSEILVNYNTEDDTAVALHDYFAESGTLTFAAGETSQSFAVTIIDDAVAELTETLNLSLSGDPVEEPTNATISITDDDPAPEVLFVPAALTVSENSITATLDVNLSGPSSQTVTVDYMSEEETAAAGDDYTAVSGTLTFLPGETNKTITVPILDDDVDEPAETAVVYLHNAQNGVAGSPLILTIEDDDPPVSVEIAPGNRIFAEDEDTVSVEVRLSAASAYTVTVAYATKDGTAFADSDYTAVSSTFIFAPGETSKMIVVPLLNDEQAEIDQTFSVSLMEAIHADLGQNDATVLTILDDDIFMMFVPLLMFGT